MNLTEGEQRIGSRPQTHHVEVTKNPNFYNSLNFELFVLILKQAKTL